MMRSAFLFLVMCLLAGQTVADPNDLSRGVLVAHLYPVPDPCRYAPVNPCVAYAPYAINGLSEVTAQLTGGQGTCFLWYVLAAWEGEDKTWCGTEFGFGTFDPYLFDLRSYQPCFPVAGLEIPTPGWPGPNQGTAFVTTGTPWTGNWLPVYCFWGYAYGYAYGSTVFPISVDPSTGFCGFSNCSSPPLSFAVGPEQRGGMGINMPGIVPVFPSPPSPWACCIPVAPYCVMVLEQECALLGGCWHQGVTCEQLPCPRPSACCIAGECSMLFQANCELVGGTWMPDVTCTPNPCVAVCCFQQLTSPHGCEIMLEADCLAAGGAWLPMWAECTPINPCEIYTPAENTSWGRIKDLYR